MPDSAEIFRNLRSKVLALRSSELGISPLPSGVWGALMEFCSGEVPVTLVAVLDGTTSLYFASGGGIIGAGKSDVVRKANHLFLEVAGKCVGGFQKVEAYPTAQPGRVRFYVLMADGVRASEEVDESSLADPATPLRALWAAGQNVITHIRLVQQAKTS